MNQKHKYVIPAQYIILKNSTMKDDSLFLNKLSFRRFDDSHLDLQLQKLFFVTTLVGMVLQTQSPKGLVDFFICRFHADPQVVESIFQRLVFWKT